MRERACTTSDSSLVRLLNQPSAAPSDSYERVSFLSLVFSKLLAYSNCRFVARCERCELREGRESVLYVGESCDKVSLQGHMIHGFALSSIT